MSHNEIFVVDVQVDDVFVCCLNQVARCAKGTNNKAELRLTFRTAVSHRHKINDMWIDANSSFLTSSDCRIIVGLFLPRMGESSWIPRVQARFLLIFITKIQIPIQRGFELLPVKVLELLHGIFLQEITLLVHRLRDRRGRHDGEAFESDAVNVGLIFLRATKVLLPTDLLVVRLRRLERQQLRNRSSVGRGPPRIQFSNICQTVHKTSRNQPCSRQFVPTCQGTVFHHRAQEFVLSKGLSREVHRKTLWIDPDDQEIQQLWNELVKVSQRELSTDVQLDIGVLFWFRAHR